MDQEKIRCVTCYVLAQSIAEGRRKFRTRYQKTPPACTSILRWIEIFSNLRNVENRTGRKTPQLPANGVNSQFILLHPFNKVPEELGCRFRDSILHHTELHEKANSHVSVQDIKSTSLKITRLCLPRFLFSMVWEHHVVRFRFPTSARFSDECISHDSGFSNF